MVDSKTALREVPNNARPEINYGPRTHMAILDSVRAFAAMYVVMHHLRFMFDYEWIKLLLSFGQEAVIVFFVLSGFVIAWTNPSFSNISFKLYMGKRVRRIYPVFLVALLLSALIYIPSHLDVDYVTLLGNLFMLQDDARGRPGAWFGVFAGNSPLWSLSYEIWFYVLYYFIVRYVDTGFQTGVVLLLSITSILIFFAWPNQISVYISYFLIWWMGVVAARQYRKQGFVTYRCMSTVMAGALASSFAWFVGAVYFLDKTIRVSPGLWPYLQVRHFIGAIAITFSFIFFSRLITEGQLKLLGRISPFAAVSYSLYLFHYPILLGGMSLMRQAGWLELAGLSIILLLASWFFEVFVQGKINEVTDRLWFRRPRPQQNSCCIDRVAS